ncbi:MAG: HAMP domain-containing histidine kinase, partial [Lentisphaerae bacterium]|nr:HAMP domain-containing histidine kinase [Lentisphaerota bacterium]
HELKAPFAAIHANTQLLANGYCGALPDKALEVVLRIGARSRRLGHEIQDMLQLANLSAPSQRDQPSTDIDLRDVLAWCVEQAQARAQERSVPLEYVPTSGPIRIRAVEDHLKMLFINLLTNAVNYSYGGGTVTLSCRPASCTTGLLVAVRDHGIGIHPDKLPRVFDEYYRTDEAVQHCRESTGLGLAIVHHIAQAHGLSVSVTSRLKEGTEFRVEFPNHMHKEPSSA